jgi:hypothetical protein
MGAESYIRGKVITALHMLHAVAIENAVDKGTPDINCLAGWIELKQLGAWPKRETSVVTIPHFTQEQRIWLTRRCESGGAAWLLLRVGHEWLLFWGHWAAKNINSCTRAQLVEGAVAYWPDGLNGAELVRFLIKSIPGIG